MTAVIPAPDADVVLQYRSMSPDEAAEFRKKTATVLSRHAREPGSLIPILQDIQQELGYLPQVAMSEVARHLQVPETDIYGIATFYATFSLVPRGRYRISVCLGTACHVRGATRVVESLERELGIGTGGTTEDRMFSLDTVRCLGCCGRAPVLTVNEDVHGNATTAGALKTLERYRAVGAGEK